MQSALATAEARNTFVLELKRGGRATFKDVKLALALLFPASDDSIRIDLGFRWILRVVVDWCRARTIESSNDAHGQWGSRTVSIAAKSETGNETET